MQDKHLGWLVIVLLMLGGLPISAQSNVVAGYKMAYILPPEVDRIVSDYNTATNFAQPLPDLTDMHGIMFGYRYRFGAAALEASWSNVGATMRAEGLTAAMMPVNKRIGWSITQYDAGLQLHSGVLSFGSGVGYRRIKTETDIDGIEADREIFNVTDWVVNAHIGIEVNSERIGFAIQPYVTYPLGPADITQLDVELNGPTTAVVEEDFLTFGIKVVLYNGPQE